MDISMLGWIKVWYDGSKYVRMDISMLGWIKICLDGLR